MLQNQLTTAAASTVGHSNQTQAYAQALAERSTQETTSLGQTRINSTYQSTTEQSGIRAGDGGFQVQVDGQTTLVGGAITSTQAAIDNQHNAFTTAGQSAQEALASGALTMADLNNHANYSANSVSVGLGAGAAQPGQSASAALSGVGIGRDSGSASSTTLAAISGLAGNTEARTGDAGTGIGPIFDADKVRREVNAQVQITQEFGKQASKAVGDYASAQLKAAQAAGDTEGMAAWAEGGSRRVLLHTLVGGLTGGVQGALGAGAASAAAPQIEQLQEQLTAALQEAGLGDSAANLIASLASGATAATIGGAAGGTAGAATAFNADLNNRQLHPDERKRAADLAKKSGGRYTQEEIENAMRNAGNRDLGEDITTGMTARSNDEVYDPGAVWRAGELGSGAIVQELPNQGRVAPELAAFIQAHTGGSTTPYYWSDVQLGKVQPPAPNPNAHLNTLQPNAKGQITAEAAAGLLPVRNPIRDIEDIRHDVADGAAVVGRGADITAATSTMAAAVPGPHQPGAATTAAVATGVGFAANAIEQLARPDVGVSAENSIYMAIQMRIDSSLPIAAPITNEVINAWKNSNTNLELKEWAGIEWRKFLDSRGKP